MTTELTAIHFEIAERGAPATNAAAELTFNFGFGNLSERPPATEKFIDAHLFDGYGKPRVIAVGYAGDIATTAATISEDVRQAQVYDTAATADFNNRPYLNIWTLARDPAYRQQQHGRQLVMATLELAGIANYHRVQAVFPLPADQFWQSCGFQKLPYDMPRNDRYRLAETGLLLPETTGRHIAGSVVDRLQAFSG